MQAHNTIASEEATDSMLTAAERRKQVRELKPGADSASEISSDGIGIEFLANLAHQLRSPLSSLRVWVDLLQDPATLENPDGAKRLVEGIDRATSRLERQISDVLEVGYLQAGSLTIEFGSVDAAEQIALAAAEAEFVARSRRIEIDIEIPGGDLTVHANERRVRQIVSCLLSNAIRFSPVDGTVSITAGREPHIAGKAGVSAVLDHDVEATVGHSLFICVSNSGPTIPVHLHDEIFRPFQRAVRKDAHGGGGSGLGLTIARGLVELHHGGMWLHSDPADGADSGAQFEFSIPVEPAREHGRSTRSRRGLN